MTTEQIALIKESWSALLADVRAHYDNILSTEDLKNLTVNQLLELIEFSKNLIGKMEALFCDYRHIIGMATIKITDRNFLTSILRDIELYRTDAKRIAGITDLNLVNLIPASSTYELKLTPGIELKSKVRPGQEEPETSSEVEIPLTPESDPESFMRLAGDNIIKFTLDKLEEDNYYVKDLIGCDIIDIKNDEILGKLDYIFNTGANDVYEVTTTSNTKVYLPAIKQVIKKVDIKSRKIYVEIMEGLI